MGEWHNNNGSDFADYLQSVVKLDALQQMTEDLDKELEDSQMVMDKIKEMYSSISTLGAAPMPAMNSTQPLNLSKLDVDLPNLLLPDMVENTMDVDVDDIIASMRNYAENLKKNIVVVEIHAPPKDYVPLEIEQYASSLDQLSKRLANMKITKRDDARRNLELEAKLTQLCNDVDLFNKMVQAKTTISEHNQNWVETCPDASALKYDALVNKLLSGINEVTYLLQNKN